MAIEENFRFNLRAAMKARRITQGGLAASMGTSRPYVNSVLKGRNCVSLRQAERLADAVGCPLQWLIESPDAFSLRVGSVVATDKTRPPVLTE